MIIADDEQMTREGLRSMEWDSEGFIVKSVASDGDEALQAFRQHRPHIVLTDIRMPCLDGLQLTRIIREESSQTKVILMTAYHDIEYAKTAIELGAIGFFLKPSDPDEIMEGCRKARQLLEDDRRRAEEEKVLRKQVREFRMALEGKLTGDRTGAPRHKVVEEVMQYIQAHYMDELTITKAASYVYLNPVYLSRLIKRETGETFSDIVVRIRMNKALELLRDPGIKVYEIADRIGFHDSRYFSQLFKKHFGQTPKAFRAKIHEGDHEKLV